MLSRVERDVCQYFGQQELFQPFGRWHSRQIGRQFMPMLLSLPGLRIRMIIALCHIIGICPVEIDRSKMLVR